MCTVISIRSRTRNQTDIIEDNGANLDNLGLANLDNSDLGTNVDDLD